MIDPILGGALVVCGISVVLAFSGGFAVQLLPRALHEGWLSLSGGSLFVLCIAVFVLAAAYAASFVGQAMTDSAAGGAHEWHFDIEFERAARFAAGGLASLLSGPILFLGGGIWYWLHCGAMTGLDWLILTELALAGIGSWLALSCASAALGQFALSCPARFRAMMRGLGFRGAAILSAATLLIALHLALAVCSCRQMQSGDGSAVFWLAACTFSALIVATLLLSQVSRVPAVRRPGCA